MTRKPTNESSLTVFVVTGNPEGELARFSGFEPDAGFVYDGVLTESDGAAVISEITIKPLGFGGVTAAMLRAVPLRSIVPAAATQLDKFKWVMEHIDDVDDIDDASKASLAAARDASVAVARAASVASSTRHAGGRAPLSDAFLEGIAREYLEIQSELGGGRGVIAGLAERHLTGQPTVRVWVRRASDAGFLSTSLQGRAGRAPGPRLPPRKRPTRRRS